MCDRCGFLAEAEKLPLADALDHLRDHLLERAYARSRHNVRLTARLLRCDRRIVQRWLAVKRNHGAE
jgi:ActR/RegA family two-component response regulator